MQDKAKQTAATAGLRLTTRKLTPAIGAEIAGVDLSQPLDEALKKELYDAFLEHLVLFFRDQRVSVEHLKTFGRYFGQLHRHPAPLNTLGGDPEVLVVYTDADSKRIAGEDWHSDVSCDIQPPLGSILHLNELPASGGDTLFASMYAAYEGLSDALQRFLSSLTATHDGARNYAGRSLARSGEAHYPSAEHPVVRTHPETGRKALFVNRLFTTRIVQLKPNESSKLLEMLFEHLTRPEFHCRFRWSPGSVAFWDNRCTQHIAVWDYYPERRYGHRITISGDRPFFRP